MGYTNILNKLTGICQQSLSQEAIDYLIGRGLTRHSIERFRIGLITEEAMKGMRLHRDFKGMIYFPILYRGETKHFTARAIGWAEKPHRHLSGDILHMYNHDGLDRKDIFIAESPIDCITLWQNGFNAVAKLGKGPVREEISQGMVGKNIFVCYDTDANFSGQKGAKKLAEGLNKLGIKPRIIQLPLVGDKTDINSFFVDHTREDFIELIYSSKVYYREPRKKKILLNESSLRIEDVVEQYIDNPMRTHKGYQCVCPFHDDKSPSMHIYTATNSAFCFAGCGYFSAERLKNQLQGK